MFVSGCPPIKSETGKVILADIVVQTEQVMENVKAILTAAGTSMDKMVKTNIFIAAIRA